MICIIIKEKNFENSICKLQLLFDYREVTKLYFTHSPVINGKKEPRICGEGPSLAFYLTDDVELAEEKQNINQLFIDNYKVATKYTNKFDFIREFFAQDELIQEDEIEKEENIEKFRKMCIRYHEEVKIIDSIILSQALGILNLQLKNFKDEAKPQPVRLLAALTNILPSIGKKKIDELVGDTEDMEKTLNQQAVITIEYVRYLEYLEEANNKLNNMETQLDYCKELYDIMEEFEIMAPDEDMSNYLNVSVLMASLRNLVDKKTDGTSKIIEAFDKQMRKDISSLISEVGIIKDECMVS